MGKTTIAEASNIMGKYFIGPDDLDMFSKELNIASPIITQIQIPEIPFSKNLLKNIANTHLLILGIPLNASQEPLTLVSMRFFFSVDPSIKEPCFYNQDWYFNEKFANTCKLEFKWYLLGRNILNNTRGLIPENQSEIELTKFPSALLLAFAFFANYFKNKEYLWEKEFIWCSDKDNNGDRIYVARYIDPSGLSKNGFSIHRHLSVKQHYGCIEMEIDNISSHNR